jgi:hypothetical protein
LIEAINFNLPIITVNLSYSRWVCEDQAYYFEPYSAESFFNALSNLVLDIKLKKVPNYTNLLKKFPTSWEQVVKEFIN